MLKFCLATGDTIIIVSEIAILHCQTPKRGNFSPVGTKKYLQSCLSACQLFPE